MDKKEALLKSALKLFVEFGFHATPTSKIARETGVANGTLFHYYKTKDELILALYSDIKSRLTDHVFSKVNKNDSLEQAFQSIYSNTIEWSQENRSEFRFLQQFSNSPYYSLVAQEKINEYTSPHFDLIQKGIKLAELKPLPVDLLHTLINSHIAGISQYISSREISNSRQKKIISESFQLLWDMIT